MISRPTRRKRSATGSKLSTLYLLLQGIYLYVYIHIYLYFYLSILFVYLSIHLSFHHIRSTEPRVKQWILLAQSRAASSETDNESGEEDEEDLEVTTDRLGNRFVYII